MSIYKYMLILLVFLIVGMMLLFQEQIEELYK